MKPITMTVDIGLSTFERMKADYDFRKVAPESPFIEVTLPMVPRVGDDLWWHDWHLTVTRVSWVDGCTAPSLGAK